MVFDTDVFIWIQRGSKRAAQLFERQIDRCIAVQTYMETLQCAQDRAQQAVARRFQKDFNARTLLFSPETGDRAMSQQYALPHNMRAGDALIAATALEAALPLCTSNVKHSRAISLLEGVRLVP